MKCGAAVGPRRVGPSPDELDHEALACGGERAGRMTRAVVGRHPADGDPEVPAAVRGRPGAPGGTPPLPVREQAAASDARDAAGADARAFPTAPLAAAGPGAGGVMPGPLKADGPLDIDAGHATRTVMPVVAGRPLRLQALEPGKAGVLEDPGDRGRRDAGRRGDAGPGRAMVPQREHPSDDMPRCGPARPAQPAEPAEPSTWKRPTHLDTVLAVTPNDAVASGRPVCPAITRHAASSRRKGSDRAFLCIFIGLPLEGRVQDSRHDNASLPDLDPRANLMQCIPAVIDSFPKLRAGQLVAAPITGVRLAPLPCGLRVTLPLKQVQLLRE